MKTKPIKKDPDELWSSYLLRRLESEGLLKTRDKLGVECYPDGNPCYDLGPYICGYRKWHCIHLNDNNDLAIVLKYKPTFFIKSPANKFGGIDFKLIYEEISVPEEIAFSFKKNVAKLESEYMDEKLKIKHEPFIKYKSNVEAGINAKYPPEGVIDDLVQYVKSVGIKLLHEEK